MSFKLKDYNAFLTSLYEKKPTLKREQQSSDEFPVDFDFGLAMSTENKPDSFDNINTEFIAETGASNLMNNSYMGLSGLQPPDSPTDSQTILQIGELPFSKPHVQAKEKSNEPQTSRPTFAKAYSYSQFGPLDTNIDDKTFNASLSEAQSRPRTKSAHNIIEQRYRNKINDKFTILQNTVPTLRVAKRKLKGWASPDFKHHDEEESIDDCSGSEDEDLEGLEPAKKLNKGTILTKSIEYIKFLEMKNNTMHNENEQLIMKARLLGIPVDEALQYK